MSLRKRKENFQYGQRVFLKQLKKNKEKNYIKRCN